MTLFLDLRQFSELNPSVVFLNSLYESLGVLQQLLLRNLFVLEVIEDCFQTSDPVIKLKLVFAG